MITAYFYWTACVDQSSDGMSWTKESSAESSHMLSSEDNRGSRESSDATSSPVAGPEVPSIEVAKAVPRNPVASLVLVTNMKSSSSASPPTASSAPVASELVEIIVKCPAALAGVEGDYSLKLAPDSSVGYLKELLSRDHPCRPSPPDQRLVFRGQLLSDRLQIEDMCQRENSRRLVVHMVLRSGNYRCSPHPEKGAAFKNEESGNAIVNTLEPRTLPLSRMRSLSSSITENMLVPDVNPSSSTGHGTSSSSPAASSMSILSLPSAPAHGSSASYYCGVVNNHGQVVYADLSQAVLYDGYQFYLTRGSALASSLSSSGSGDLPPQMNRATATRRRPTTRAVGAPGPRGLRRNVVVHRINIDLGAILSFLLRFGIIMLIFAQGGSTMRISILCVLFGLFLLGQAGLFNFLGMQEMTRRLWAPIVRIREQQGQQQEQQQEPGAHQFLAPQGREARHPNVDQMNPLLRLIEVVTTFWLSLFPTEPPNLPQLANNNRNERNPAVAQV